MNLTTLLKTLHLSQQLYICFSLLLFVCSSIFAYICSSNEECGFSSEKGAACYGYILLWTSGVVSQHETSVDNCTCKYCN